ncbi:MAG: TRZ/ATZ family hydrolase [Gammaproteobacteria bacterium]|nr:TRZ/ATZ family hydrolase [Gammaproteobacteria bacterium]
MTPTDTLINASWILTVDDTDTVLIDHAIVLHQGKILAILPQAQAAQQFHPETTIHLPGQALIPGLINAHTHAAMSLLRGMADDLPLMTWLAEHIWPAEKRWISEQFVADGTQLAIAEMLRGGTTCFNDMYFFPDVSARTAANIGMRASIGLIVLDFPTLWANDADEYLHKGLEVRDSFKAETLITTTLAPHAPYTVADKALEKVAMFANELDLPVHMHIHETEHEISEALEKTGKRPMQRLADLGLLLPNLIGVHMTQLTEGEIECMQQASMSVAHCPESNMKLASGFCPTAELVSKGINVAIGTDGAASNNDLDMLGEMRSAALIGKGIAKNASALPASQVLRMGTINGAKALGINHITGSLEVGKAADITAINLSGIENQPLYDAASQIIYSANRNDVSNVWVAGRHLLKERELTTMNEREVLQKARHWQEKIASH